MFYTTRPYRPKQIDRDVDLDSKALEKRDQENFSEYSQQLLLKIQWVFEAIQGSFLLFHHNHMVYDPSLE